jgi:hypothetical protein
VSGVRIVLPAEIRMLKLHMALDAVQSEVPHIGWRPGTALVVFLFTKFL